ncbi:MAG: coproporphyrinogen-III oxidase family protein [Acidobacteriota bacterium]
MAESAAPTAIGSVFVSNYPPYSAWKAEEVPAVHRMLQEPPRPGTSLGLYLHIPFCRRRCKFCYFKVHVDKNAGEIRRYMDALGREVESYARQAAVGGRPLRFVYFGGGTPSFVSARQLERLAKKVKAVLPWMDVEEVTFECEPGTLTESKLQAIRGIGVTRLSLGVESFRDDILRENGRAHLAAEIERTIPWIEACGFEQLNIDLIAGMVGETWESWRASVQKTIDLGPDSVTIYQMELPYNTLYSRELLEGTARIRVAGWETKRAWQQHAFQQLEEAGFALSSAYTMVKKKTGGRFVYRDELWHGGDMLGVGIASFSHLNGIHFQNVSRWDDYLAGVEAGDLPLERAHVTSREDRLTRELILCLKLGGLDAGALGRKFGVDILERYRPVLSRLEEEGMLRVRQEQIELTRAGLMQVDRLLPGFYAPEHRNVRYT